jgi:hypothetical protein
MRTSRETQAEATGAHPEYRERPSRVGPGDRSDNPVAPCKER